MQKNGKVLVLAANYPDDCGNVSLMYIHTRNLYYVKQGINVDVLNFASSREYVVDGIPVFSPENFRKMSVQDYDLLILHAANLRQHYRFLKKHNEQIKKMIFFFHGHEVLRINEVYPKKYPYVKKRYFLNALQNAYDTIKLVVWRHFFIKNLEKVYFVFVSQWMKKQFLKWTKVPFSMLEGRNYVIYNSVGVEFEIKAFDSSTKKDYDFITIRPNWDGSKYSIDIVNKLAWMNPQYRFLLIGKGDFFRHNRKAPNLYLLKQHLQHEKITDILQTARYALMPTRTDAQGLMMCEMATFGMPLITSDIPVCREIFDGFENVEFIDNMLEKNEINEKLLSLEQKNTKKMQKFFSNHTVMHEVSLILDLISISEKKAEK